MLQKQGAVTATKLAAAKALQTELTEKAALAEDDDYMANLARQRLCRLATGEVYFSEYMKNTENTENTENMEAEKKKSGGH